MIRNCCRIEVVNSSPRTEPMLAYLVAAVEAAASV